MKTVVIVDDERIVIQGIESMLGNSEFDVSVVGSAEDGLTAFDLLRELEPDIIFADIRIPKMDGLSLLESARTFLPDSAFIVISGYQDFEYCQRALRIGAIDYITKPLLEEKIHAAMLKAFSILDDVPHSDHNDAENSIIQGIFELMNKPNAMSIRGIHSIFTEKNANGEPKYDRLIIYKALCVLTIIAFNYSSLLRRQIRFLPSYTDIKEMKDADLNQFIDNYIGELAQYLLPQSHDSNEKIVRSVVEYIDEHYYKEITLNQLSKIANMNPTYLSVIFKNIVGSNYIKYLTEVRVERAKKLLLEGKRVTDVCGDVGYNNYRYFSTVFKAETGIAPGKYKEVIQSEK